ncbi:MAG: hypothetical protein P8L66_05450, partial [Rhodospirillaceae bacterium]|nr:hypothetical protein [Rhodospirillaceae bacterium]
NALKILITDPTCFDDEYPKKTHWGHPPVGRVVEIATAVKVKALHLFQHDPAQSDTDIERKLSFTRDTMSAVSTNTTVKAPQEGSTYHPWFRAKSPFLFGQVRRSALLSSNRRELNDRHQIRRC